jgi:hypothetical protein
LAIIINEATPMRKYPAHPQANQALRTSAATNARMGILISVLSLGTFFNHSS